MAKKKLTTPKGVAVYPHVNQPDTRFNKEGIYSIKLRLEGEEADQLVREIDAEMKASYQAAVKTVADAAAKNKKKPAKVKQADPPYQRDEDTGAVSFTFKMNATGKTKTGEVFTRQPVIFDKYGKPVQGMKLGGGSTVRVSYDLFPFYTAMVGAGVSLRLAAVQVLKLVEFGADAGYYGFEAEAEEGEVEGTPAGDKDVPLDESQAEDDAPPGSEDF